MRKRTLASTALAALLWTNSAHAMTAHTNAGGSVNFSFGTQPLTIEYGFNPPFFGFGAAGTGIFGDDFTGSVSDDGNTMSAAWDPLTGSTTAFDYSLVTDSGFVESFVFVETRTLFTVFTDVLMFSYDYSFGGELDTLEVGNFFGFGTVLEVVSGTDVFYTDFDIDHPTYRTKRVNLRLQGEAGVPTLEGSGIVTFQYGTPGEFREWNIEALIQANGQALVPVPAALPLFLTALVSFGVVRRRRDA